MPKNVVEITPVNKEFFLHVLKEKGSSIRKLGAVSKIACSEKTIRRELNTRGGLRKKYLDRIAEYLDVDPRFLSGSLLSSSKGRFFSSSYLLNYIDAYPYSREEEDRLHSERIDETIKRILALYEISYNQFQEKGFEEQYSFQHDLFSAILPVMYKHFDRDRYGDTERWSFEEILCQLEEYRDEYYEEKYADEILRETFLKSPPEGYSPSQILKMSPSELIGLDLFLQSQIVPTSRDEFEEQDTSK